jgi:hypothetical protein
MMPVKRYGLSAAIDPHNSKWPKGVITVNDIRFPPGIATKFQKRD